MSTYGFKSYRHARISGLICFVALAGMLSWAHFFLNGTRVSWTARPFATGAFFAWVIVAAFGVGYGGGRRRGLRYAAYALGAVVLASTLREFVLA